MTTEWMMEEYLRDWKHWQGNCYEAAARLVMAWGDDYTLVHGYPLGRGKIAGIRFGHAWVEKDGIAYDLTIPGGADGMPVAVFYALGSLDCDDADVRYYSKSLAMAEMVGHKHYGPWHGMDYVPKKIRRKRSAQRVSP